MNYNNPKIKILERSATEGNAEAYVDLLMIYKDAYINKIALGKNNVFYKRFAVGFHNAEDIYQSVSLGIIRRKGYDYKKCTFATYLSACLKNRCCDLFRNNKSNTIGEDVSEHANNEYLGYIQKIEINEGIFNKCFEKLSDDHKDLLSLRIRGVNRNGISAALGIPPGTVATRGLRAYAELKRHYEACV